MRYYQRGITTSIILIIFLLTGVAIASAYFVFSQKKQKATEVNSFEDCAKYYPVMELYPQQCNTPNGRHFVQQLSEEEKEKLSPPAEDSNSADETVSWKTYTNKEQGYLISYPENWMVLKDTLFDGILGGGIKYPDKEDDTILQIETYTGDMSFDRFAYFYHLNPKAVPKKISIMEINGVNWEQWSDSDSVDQLTYVLATEYKRKKYFLTKSLDSESKSLIKNSLLIEEMIQSFKFLE